MPLLEVGNAHPSFHHPNPLSSQKVQIPCHGKQSSVSFAFGLGQCVPCSWKYLDNKLNHNSVKFNVIKAVAATLEEPKSSLAPKGNEWYGLNPSNPPKVRLEPMNQSSNEDDDSEEIDEREKLRRMRISKANKGIAPWNKGRKHSAETLRKIKERTRLAMQNPKIKLKLINSSHPQTIKTREKIGAAVKMTWARKRERRVVQETCCLEWQNSIAEASRQGYGGQEELQWDSYEVLDEQLKLEWMASVEKRKRMPRPQGSKRAPKTPEQRRKIAEAIYAKWSDPGYRKRVCNAMTKDHGTKGSETKPRRQPSGDAQRRKPTMKKDTKIVKQVLSKKSNAPPYKDPLVSSKLAMIKSIRAQRGVTETKQANAIEQARLLIAEAEKAAKALEVAAAKSPIAQVSLRESRRLIAEAIESLESIHKRGTISNAVYAAMTQTNKEQDEEFEVLNQPFMFPLNGHKTLSLSDNNKLVNGSSELPLTSSNGYASYDASFSSKIEEATSSSYEEKEAEPRRAIVTRKWICGRLVEVAE
ncbi:hypothetical protein HN51_043630 [Arachis hypogaea]|uniref:Nuclease associated modular domain-containing protein n=1 Tax=Arachis hypogaea TaxID=3818 RepID=A0A444Y5Z3_ARAHY|nr:uncharacterized protein LOC112772398 [Arachis hypogaea]QHN95682.1 uncharacterized protein DS421_18g611850 [Arachis hypogaea]RYQ97317.1 hypothetical protein Ahy_B08g093352 [Arachis hypogaea]